MTIHEKLDYLMDRVTSNDFITGNNTVTLYNSNQANIISITNENLPKCKLVHLTFLSAAAGDTITNLNWIGANIDSLLLNQTFGSIQHYIAKLTFTSNNITLKADYPYARSRECRVFIFIV